MPRASNLRSIRALSLALVVAGALLAVGGLSARASGEAGSPPPDPTATPPAPADPSTPPAATAVPVAPDPSGAQPSSATTAPVTTPPPPSSSPPVAVQVARATASASKSVSIVDFAFNPGTITVHAGDTVQWTNDGQVPEGHNVTGAGLHSGTLHSGASFSHTFSSAGTFSYECTIHPSMQGTVHVLAASSSSGSSGSSGSGSSGSSGSGSTPTSSTPSTTGAGTESAAVASPGAAGSSDSLPSTGTDSLGLATAGLLLIGLGVGLRLIGLARAVSRRA